jgi:uncharacterized protein
VDLQPLSGSRQPLINRYRAGGFRVGGVDHVGSVLIVPQGCVAWPVSAFDQMTEDSLAPVISAEPTPDILLIGCGSATMLVPRTLRESLKAAGVSVDAMETGAACRTYNMLIGEGRRVGAALIPV